MRSSIIPSSVVRLFLLLVWVHVSFACISYNICSIEKEEKQIQAARSHETRLLNNTKYGFGARISSTFWYFFFSQRIYRYLLLLLLLSSLLLYSLSPSSHYKHTTKASMFAHIFYFFSRRFNRGKIGFMIFQWYLLDPLPTSNIIIPCTINNYIFIMTITYILISAYFLLTNKHFNKSLRISD